MLNYSGVDVLQSKILLAFSHGDTWCPSYSWYSTQNHEIAPWTQNPRGAGKLRTIPLFRSFPTCNSAPLYLPCWKWKISPFRLINENCDRLQRPPTWSRDHGFLHEALWHLTRLIPDQSLEFLISKPSGKWTDEANLCLSSLWSV